MVVQMHPTAGGKKQPDGIGQAEDKKDQKAPDPVAARSDLPLQGASGALAGSTLGGAADSPPNFSLKSHPTGNSWRQNVPDSAGIQGEISTSAPRSTEDQAEAALSGRQTSSGRGQESEKEPVSLGTTGTAAPPHSEGKTGEEETHDSSRAKFGLAEYGRTESGCAEHKESGVPSVALSGGVNPLREPVLVQPVELVAHANPVAQGLISPKPSPAEALGNAAGPAPPSAVVSETGIIQTSPSAGASEPASETRESEPASEAVPESHGPEARPAEQAEPREPAWTPRALIAQLEAIADDPQAGPWARQVLMDLRALIPLLRDAVRRRGCFCIG